MKKILIFTLAILLALFSIASCKKAGAPKAGTAKADDMLNLLPKAAGGVIVADIHRAMSTELANKAIKEDKNYPKYQEFIQKTGIDPQKDIFFLAAALTGNMAEKDQEGVAVVNLKYDREKALSILKAVKIGEQGVEEEVYNGVTIYCPPKSEEAKESACGAFLDNSNVVLGNNKSVKAVIDVYQKKAESVLKNKEFVSLIKAAKKDAMFWSVFAFPPEATKQAAAQNPMLKSLESIKSLSMYFDYKNKNILAEIKAMSSDEAKNKEIADLLNGLKAMGSMASTKEPGLGELLNSIEISSAADHVKISARISEDVINRLKEKAEKKLEEKLKGQEKQD